MSADKSSSEAGGAAARGAELIGAELMGAEATEPRAESSHAGGTEPLVGHAFANDPLELLAVDGKANQTKSDGDAATWLPPNKPFRCAYVARQVAVKKKYSLWVTRSEYDAMAKILQTCPDQQLPS